MAYAFPQTRIDAFSPSADFSRGPPPSPSLPPSFLLLCPQTWLADVTEYLRDEDEDTFAWNVRIAAIEVFGVCRLALPVSPVPDLCAAAPDGALPRRDATRHCRRQPAGARPGTRDACARQPTLVGALSGGRRRGLRDVCRSYHVTRTCLPCISRTCLRRWRLHEAVLKLVCALTEELIDCLPCGHMSPASSLPPQSQSHCDTAHCPPCASHAFTRPSSRAAAQRTVATTTTAMAS